MNDLTNSKIESLVPKWSSFFGMSLLFDNPGNSLSPFFKTKEQEIFRINCPSEIPFYRGINQCLEQLSSNLPINDYLFCRLPYYSYHCTVNDLSHKDNLQDFKPTSRAAFSNVFDNYPASLDQVLEFNPFFQESEIITKKDWAVRCQFSHRRIWGDSVIVARLKPANEKSEIKFEKLKKLRKGINDSFQELHGYSQDIKDEYSIHLSIAYFGNEQYGRKFKPLLEKFNNHFLKRMKDDEGQPLEIEFNSISLYGFTDMATFFKVEQKSKNMSWPGSQET